MSNIWNQCVPQASFGAIYQFIFRCWSPWGRFCGEHCLKLWDGPPGVTQDFKWQGWSKDFFGFEIFDIGIFWIRKFGQVVFWVAWFKQFEDLWEFPRTPGALVPQIKYKTKLVFQLSLLSGNYYGSKIRQGIFWGLNFVPGVFLGFDFCPIRSSLSLEVRRTPLPPLWGWDKVNMIRRVCIVQYRIVFWFHLAKRIIHSGPGWDKKVLYCSLF